MQDKRITKTERRAIKSARKQHLHLFSQETGKNVTALKHHSFSQISKWDDDDEE